MPSLPTGGLLSALFRGKKEKKETTLANAFFAVVELSGQGKKGSNGLPRFLKWSHPDPAPYRIGRRKNWKKRRREKSPLRHLVDEKRRKKKGSVSTSWFLWLPFQKGKRRGRP